MKKTINALVIDDNISSIQSLKKYFSSHAVINVVLEAHNGEEGLKCILEHEGEYDVIIMDLIMPKKDGVAVLEELKQLNKNKKIIILTSYNKEESIRRLRDYNISYFMLKPYSFEDLEKRIIDIINLDEINLPAQKTNLHISISRLLHSLGVPSHIKGYEYIRESIYMMYEKPSMLGGITKRLYPEIANKYETTSSRVERAIRHAIEVSWNRGDYDLMEEIFGHSVDYDRAKPTNSEFIATLADKIRLDNGLNHI